VTPLLDKLPTILVLAVFVGIFLSLRRHSPSVRVRLWTYAWALIFLHFFIQIFETRTGVVESIFEAIDLAALEMAGMVFIISLTRAGENRLRRIVLFAVLAPTTTFHAFAITFDWHVRWALAGSLAVMAFGAAAYAVLETKTPDIFDHIVAVVLCVAGVWAIKSQLAGSPDFAVNAILSLSFGICGPLYWIRHPRRSPGVFVVSGGFLCWGAVFPVAAALGHFMPKLQVNPELWNVPKFFVAFGMVLALLEEKSRIIERAHERERAENRLLERLSQISSRLLAGKDPAALCQEIAVAVTDASSFSRAALFLVGEGGALRLAGSSGLSAREFAELEQRSATWRIDGFKQLRTSSMPIGNSSFRLAQYENEILVPLASWRGSALGCFWLSSNGTPDNFEIVKLEMLASDLAVTVENTRLHSQLVRSEKLAALGQLVAGVAHELNNPLTGIMGYTELLGEEIQKESTLKRVQKLGNEARRMKRIVDGLLRFARQNNPAARTADLDAALKDVIQLREYHVRKLGILVDVRIAPGVPPLAIGEDELKQVLLNILNNSIDAVEESAKREIRIMASQQNGRTIIQFDDSGPGFSDVNRAFDPFYTTKPVGKGTGLGLSICYGIAQECGGEISLANKQPYGASVYLELPAAVAQSMVPVPA
jgi:two-component system, NtrC family, sensor kinase